MDSVAIDVKVVSCLPVISPRETSHDGKIFYKGQLLTMAEFEAKGYRDELSNRSILCPDEFDGYRFICGLLVNEAAYHEIMTGLYARKPHGVNQFTEEGVDKNKNVNSSDDGGWWPC